jgi:hypothetical protein
MSDPNHTSRTSKVDIRIPHDLLARLDAIAARTNGNRTSAILLVLSAGLVPTEREIVALTNEKLLPTVRSLGAPSVGPAWMPALPDVPEWAERWRGRFASATDTEIARIEGIHRLTVAKWRKRVGRGVGLGSSP